MNFVVKIRFSLFVLTVILMTTGLAIASDENSSSAPDTTRAGEEPYEIDTLVVTASRKEQAIEEVPASVTVFGASDMETAPTDDFFADGLRVAPGLNVA